MIFCHCNKELAYCEATISMRDHLSRIHPSKYLPDSSSPAEKKTAPKINSLVKKLHVLKDMQRNLLTLWWKW